MQGIEKVKNNIIVYPIFTGEKLPEDLKVILGEKIEKKVKRDCGKITNLYLIEKLAYKEIIFLGLGEKEKISRNAIKIAITNLEKEVEEDIDVYLNHMIDMPITIEKMAYYMAEEWKLANQELIQFKSDHITKKEKQLNFITMKKLEGIVEKAYSRAIIIQEAKQLVQLPPNMLYAETFIEKIHKKANEIGVLCNIYEEKKLKEMGAGGILAVNQGSVHSAYLAVLEYQGNPEKKEKIGLIGKGITYDSGGYNLKTPQNLLLEKGDMTGAANALAALKIAVKEKKNVNVLAILPIAENVVDGKGYRCDDVITTLSGKTVEITNTDAEGRLLLADGIEYAKRNGCTKIIDIATLTGGCIKALGDVYSGVFSNNEEEYRKIYLAAKEEGEKLWRLPLDEAYTKEIKNSNIADLINSTGNSGLVSAGASIAAAFLEQFVGNIPWIHIDIAGTAIKNNVPSGIMIETIVNYLSKLAEI